MKRLAASVVFAAVSAFGCPHATAIEGTPFLVGVQGHYGTTSKLGLGVRGEYNLDQVVKIPRVSLLVQGSFDYFTDPSWPGGDLPDTVGFESTVPEDVSWWDINVNVLASITRESLKPYVGAGLRYSSVENDIRVMSSSGRTLSSGTVDDSAIGLNFIAGSKLELGMATPFAEAKLEMTPDIQLVFTVGVLF